MPLPFEYLQQLYFQHSYPWPRIGSQRRIRFTRGVYSILPVSFHLCEWQHTDANAFAVVLCVSLVRVQFFICQCSSQKKGSERKREKKAIECSEGARTRYIYQKYSLSKWQNLARTRWNEYLDRFLAEILSKPNCEVSWLDILCRHEHWTLRPTFYTTENSILFSIFFFFQFFFLLVRRGGEGIFAVWRI